MKGSSLPLALTGILVLTLMLGACVSSKKYKETVSEKDRYQMMNTNLELKVADQSRRLNGLQNDTLRLGNDFRACMTNYNELFNKSNATEQILISNLEQKEARVKELEAYFNQWQVRFDELQKVIDQKDSITTLLMRAIQDALVSFGEEDLTVTQQNGRIYVSLSEQLLFKSGSAQVNYKGKIALSKLAEVLNRNTDLQVIIEGHTDNLGIKTNCVKDNWDLSVLRATSVVRILSDEYNVDPKRMNATGRSKYLPIAANDNSDGRAMNRRTEIILAPKLEELFNILNSN